MDWAYDLAGAPTPTVRKYQVAATNTTLGRPYLKQADGGTGIVVATVSAAVDFIGVNIDAAGTYVTSQQSDNSDTARLQSIIISPLAVYRSRLCGGAANEALTAATETAGSTSGLVVTTSGVDPNSPDMNEGLAVGYSGANAGKARSIITTSANVANVTVAFPYDIAIGDKFYYVNVSPTRSILAQFTTDMTMIDASATLSGDATAVTVEVLLNDISGDGLNCSYGFIQFADHLFGATIT